MDQVAVAGGEVPLQLGVDGQHVAVEQVGPFLRLLEAKRGVDAGAQLHEAERLGKIVVGAGQKHARHLVARGLTREQDNLEVRAGRVLAQAAADFNAVHARDVDIEQDNVVRLCVGRL
jgi:hypothetical protein